MLPLTTIDPHRRRLEALGVTLLPEVVDPKTLEAIRKSVASCRAQHRPTSSQVLYTHSPPPPDRPPLSALMEQWLSPHRLDGPASTRQVAEALRPIAAKLLGIEPILFQDLLLVKSPGHRPFPWHQDFPFWPIDRPDGVVVWIPATASDSSSGALRFAKGSHQLGPRPVVDLHNGHPQSPSANLGFDPENYDILSPQYQPGDAVAFSPMVFHSSPPMKQRAERIAYASIWLSPTVRWNHQAAPNHPLCKVVPDGALVHEVLNG